MLFKDCVKMMLKMIQVVVFDADGVIVRPKTFFVSRAFELYGIPKSEFMAFIRGDFKRCTTGQLELLEILPAFLERFHVRVEASVFIRQWVEHEHHTDPQLLERIQNLRSRGTPCYLGTNQERNRANYMKLEMGFLRLFDGVYASSDLGARKPNTDFYTRLQNEIKVSPEGILFWDDSLENVLAARDAGWNAEIFTHLLEFNKIMKGYGF